MRRAGVAEVCAHLHPWRPSPSALVAVDATRRVEKCGAFQLFWVFKTRIKTSAARREYTRACTNNAAYLCCYNDDERELWDECRRLRGRGAFVEQTRGEVFEWIRRALCAEVFDTARDFIFDICVHSLDAFFVIQVDVG